MSNNLLLLVGAHFDHLDHSVQEEVYRDLYKFLYAPILYLLHDHAATEHIIQETFLKGAA
jgi:RNA polymerase sigma-70 factor (ECF subfamily)